MKISWIVLFLMMGLSACGPFPALETSPFPTPSPMDTLEPGEGSDGDQPTATVGGMTPTVDVEEEKFVRDTIFLEQVEVRPAQDQPGLVLLYVKGQLPTPCHQLGSAICPDCSQNAPNLIQVDVYSLIEKGMACRGPTTPFEQDIPLGVFTEGVYSVEVNGQHVATFDAAKLGTGDAFLEMERGNAFIEATHLTPPQSEGSQAVLTIQGYLPTPCHIFQADVAAPNEKKEIQIETYSLVPVGQVCIEVIQDFTTDVPLGLLPAGSYSVWLNGEELGVVDVP